MDRPSRRNVQPCQTCEPRICRTCGGDPKPASAFALAPRSRRDGNHRHRTECRDCANKRAKAHRLANLERYQTNARASYAADPESYRDYRLWSVFGITLDHYKRLLDAQGGGCAVCGVPPPSDRLLDVDHDHLCCPGRRSCGRCIRGLLCSPCNSGMGNLQDDPVLLVAAAVYIETARERLGVRP